MYKLSCFRSSLDTFLPKDNKAVLKSEIMTLSLQSWPASILNCFTNHYSQVVKRAHQHSANEMDI